MIIYNINKSHKIQYNCYNILYYSKIKRFNFNTTYNRYFNIDFVRDKYMIHITEDNMWNTTISIVGGII